MQCLNKNFFSQDFDRGRRSPDSWYACDTPLLHDYFEQRDQIISA